MHFKHSPISFNIFFLRFTRQKISVKLHPKIPYGLSYPLVCPSCVGSLKEKKWDLRLLWTMKKKISTVVYHLS